MHVCVCVYFYHDFLSAYIYTFTKKSSFLMIQYLYFSFLFKQNLDWCAYVVTMKGGKYAHVLPSPIHTVRLDYFFFF